MAYEDKSAKDSKDVKFKPFPSPYGNEVAKEGCDFEVSKTPSKVGFDKKDGPVPPEKGVVLP